MKGVTTYGQVTYFDTTEHQLEITAQDGDSIEFDNLMGKNVGVMEVDGIAIKIIWQGNKQF